jgi:hypothetical protein
MVHRVTEADVLQEARRLLELGWTRHVLARDAYGKSTDPLHSSACQWCFVGAMLRARQNIFETKADGGLTERAFQWAYYVMGKSGAAVFDPADWNDAICKSKEEVLALLDDAIDLAIVGE